MWGTCMGFQTLSVLAANSSDVLTCGKRNLPRGNDPHAFRLTLGTRWLRPSPLRRL